MATAFIIIVCLIILICITLAVIVGIFMHINSGLNTGELEPAGEMLDESTHSITGSLPPANSITGPLPPFILNPTQPLSEIYYHEEQNMTPPPVQTEPPEPLPLYMPQGPQPTGPLPIYHHDQ